MRAAGSVPEGLWPSSPGRRAGDPATALACASPGACLSPNLTLPEAEVPCQAPKNRLPAMPGWQSQSKRQQGLSPLLTFNCTPPQVPLRGTTPLGPSATRGECASQRSQREVMGTPEGRPCRGRAAGRRPVARRTPAGARCARLPAGWTRELALCALPRPQAPFPGARPLPSAPEKGADSAESKPPPPTHTHSFPSCSSGGLTVAPCPLQFTFYS